MNQTTTFRALLPVLAVTLFSLPVPGAQPGDSIYLCVDTLPDEPGEQKKVYGYIGGTKTDCMPEHELRGKLDSAARSDSLRQKLTSLDLDSMPHRVSAGRLQLADLRKYDLRGAELADADLRGALLTRADMRRIDLHGADLRGADLRFSYLKAANLRDANLEGALLEGAYLHFADLRGAGGLSLEQLKKVKSLFKTSMDSTLLEQLEQEYPEKFENPGTSWANHVDGDWKPSPTRWDRRKGL